MELWSLKMPKVIINRHEYKVSNIGSWVAMWLRRAGKTMKDLGWELGITHQGVSAKIKNNTFSYSDLLTVFDYLNVPEEEILAVMMLRRG